MSGAVSILERRTATPPLRTFSLWRPNTARATTSRWTWSSPAARASMSGTWRASATSTACRPIRRSTRATAIRASWRRWSSRPARLTLTSRAFRNDQLGLFYEELCALTRSHSVLPMNTGVEAVESALKVARKWGYEVKGVPDGQAEIIVCADNFHGRTLSHRRLLHRSGVARRLRPVRAGLQASCRSATPPRWRRPSAPTPSPSWSSRSRARRA